jgi:PHD/YefM family antitoxin component YafN of YafNO toxin-antitoxin module
MGAREYLISEFRKRVPEAFDRVTEEPGLVIAIVRRGKGERAVLVSETYLEALRERLSQTRRRLAAALRRSNGGTPFRLAGSAELAVPPNDVFAPSRAEQASRFEQKLVTLSARTHGRRRL